MMSLSDAGERLSERVNMVLVLIGLTERHENFLSVRQLHRAAIHSDNFGNKRK